jgi:hypothetical protein
MKQNKLEAIDDSMVESCDNCLRKINDGDHYILAIDRRTNSIVIACSHSCAVSVMESRKNW